MDKRRIKDGAIEGAIGAAYGTGTLAGAYLLFNRVPYSFHQSSDEKQKFNEVIDPLNNMITLGGLLTKEEISQTYSSINTLKELNLRDKSETQLNKIVSKLDIINSMTNIEGTLQQSQARTALVGISDQLQGIRGAEIEGTTWGGLGSFFLGAALLGVCGYGTIRKGYDIIKGGCGAIKEGYKAIFP